MHPVLIADGIIALIIIIKIVRGWRRGFFKAFAGLIAMLCAAFGSMWAKDRLSPLVSDRLLLPPVHNFLVSRLGLDPAAISAQTESLVENLRLPRFTRGILSEKIAEKIAQTGSDLLRAAAETVSARLSEIIVFAVCFIIIYIVVRALIGLLNKTILRAPIVRQCNKLLGAAAGCLAGFVIAFVLLAVAYMFFPVLTREGAILSPQAVPHSLLVRHFFDAFPGIFG